jgi:hypothetical protein
MPKHRAFALILALSAALWAADAPRSPAPPRPPAAKPAPAGPPPRPALSDTQIEAAIRARFAKSKISVNNFQVRVQGGVATIEGRTEVMQHKGTATRLAKGAGASAVNNKVQISEAARKKAGENLDQARRRVQLKRGDPRSQK